MLMFLNTTPIYQSHEPLETLISLEILHFYVPSLHLQKPRRLFTPPHHPLSTTMSTPACLLHCTTIVIAHWGSHYHSKCWVKGTLSCFELKAWWFGAVLKLHLGTFWMFFNVKQICDASLPIETQRPLPEPRPPLYSRALINWVNVGT